MTKNCLLVIVFCASILGAWAQRTTRTGLKAPQAKKEAASEGAVNLDTIASPAPHTVDINGYDKPLRSRRESFFATNNSNNQVEAMAVTLTYYDTSRRQLHRQHRTVKVSIPAGQTRQVSLPSWDIQQSFYYVRSAVPERSANASPFEVTVSVDSIFVAPSK